uniref:Uncharacterized protein n=1 Tax=viral metagenome TaxID=1070528 RepID=A0A6H2A0P8_9ZZZZ
MPTIEDLARARQTEKVYDPYTAYLQQIGIGGRQYLNPAEQYQRGLYDPLQTMYGLQQRYQLLPGAGVPAPGGSFVDYASQFGGDRAAVGQRARQLLNALYSTNPTARGEEGFAYEPRFGETGAGQGVIAAGGVEGVEGGDINELMELLQLGMRAKMGARGAGYISGRLPREQQIWTSQQAGATPSNQSFLDYLRQKYNLSF